MSLDANVADFIRSHCLELAQLARTADCETLTYILEMAALEAQQSHEPMNVTLLAEDTREN